MPFTPDQVLFLDEDNIYGADELGLPFRDLVAEGIGAAGDFLVAQRAAGANMSVDVAAGSCWIRGDDNATLQPTYRYREAAVTNLAISAADPTNPRKDIVVAEILDSTFAGVSKLGRLRAITGTPAGSPVEPALPNNALKLAMIDVPALDTSIENAQITDKRVRARVGGVGLGDFRTYTPTWGADAGTPPAIGNGTIAGRYLEIGKLVAGQIVITMGSTTTFGSGGTFYTFGLPSTPQASYDPFSLALATDTGVASYSGFCLSAGSNLLRVLNITLTNNWYALYPFTFANGDIIKLNFLYETA